MAKTEEWPGFGKRVRKRLRELGYLRPDGSEDISRFTVKHGYIVTLFYKYLDTTTPSRENLLKLAKDLECDPWWLLFGDEAMAGAGDNPRGKGARRQGRRTAGSLVLALMAGVAGMLGLHSPSMAAPPRSLPSVVQLRDFVAYTTRFRLARRLLMTTPCPA